jgi:hypothetical protein
LSQAEIVHAAEEVVKEAILAERGQVSTADLIRQLNKRQSMKTVFAEEKERLG